MSIVQTVETAASNIGADLQNFLNQVGTLLQVGVGTVAVAQQLLSLAASVTAKGAPDQADWDQLHAILDANTAALNVPMPD